MDSRASAKSPASEIDTAASSRRCPTCASVMIAVATGSTSATASVDAASRYRTTAVAAARARARPEEKAQRATLPERVNERPADHADDHFCLRRVVEQLADATDLLR